MEANVDAVNQLIQEEYRGNQSWFADDLGINISYLNEILNRRKSPQSNKLCTALIAYCEKRKKNYKTYIIFLT